MPILRCRTDARMIRQGTMIQNKKLPMRRLHSIFVNVSLALLLCAGAAVVHAQSRTGQRKVVLRAELKPREVLRYELEAAGSFLPIADASGAILTPPRGPCDYALAAIVTL